MLRSVGLRLPSEPKDVAAHWERLWRRNPALEGDEPKPPIGWALEDHGRMVGFFGNVPRLYYLGERKIIVGNASQWGVERRYRGETERLAAAYFAQPHADLLLVTTGIGPTGRIFERHGGARIPQPRYDSILYWITDVKGFLEAALSKKAASAPVVHNAARVTSWFAAVALAIGGHARGAKEARIEVHSAQAIDGNFDELWHRKRREASRLLACRDARCLKWHFAEGPYAADTHVLVARPGIDGYVILVRDDADEIGLKRYKIADVLVANDDPDILASLFKHAINFTREQGCHVLELVGPPATLRAVARRLRAISRSMPVWPAYYCAPNAEIASAISRESSWYVTPYDGDTTLI